LNRTNSNITEHEIDYSVFSHLQRLYRKETTETIDPESKKLVEEALRARMKQSYDIHLRSVNLFRLAYVIDPSYIDRVLF